MVERSAESDVRFDELVAALRDTTTSSVGETIATRQRVFASLERRASGRRRRLAMASIGFVLGAATLSWAATDGGLSPWLARVGWRAAPIEMVPIAPEIVSRVEIAPPVAKQVTVAAIERALAVTPSAPPRQSKSVRRPVEVAVPVDDGLRYRRAHELHFHGGDPDVALAAWDDYLAMHPAGRFAIEARWNRALVLVRLARYDHARAALEPFARGEVMPTGYRQRDAEALIAALTRHPQRDER